MSYDRPTEQDLRELLLGVFEFVSSIKTINDVDENGQTVLIKAARLGVYEVVDAALAAGADVDFACSYMGRNAISEAVHNGHDRIALRLIDAGSKARGCSEDEQSVLREAILNCQMDTVHAVIGAGNYTVREISQVVAEFGGFQTKVSNVARDVVYLYYPDLTACDGEGRTALENAVYHANPENFGFISPLDQRYLTDNEYKKGLLIWASSRSVLNHGPEFIKASDDIVERVLKDGVVFDLDFARDLTNAFVHEGGMRVSVAKMIYDNARKPEEFKDDTMLMWAVRNKWLGTVSAFVNSGIVDSREQAADGRTALSLAKETGAGTEIIGILQGAGVEGSSVGHISGMISGRIQALAFPSPL